MKNKTNLKIIISLLIFGILYVLIVFVLTGTNSINTGYIINSNVDGFLCKKEKCERIEIDDVKYQNKNFKVYQNSEELGTYHLKYLDKWNFYQNDNWKAIYGDFIGVEESLNYEALKINVSELNDSDFSQIFKLIQEKGLQISKKDIDNKEAYEIDLDNNKEIDKIIVLSNQIENMESKDFFSGVFIKLNGQWMAPILKVEKNIEKYSLPFYSVVDINKINNETKIILIEGYYDQLGESSSIMLKLNKNKIVIEASK